MTGFDAQVFQNEYLPAGTEIVDAIVTVTAGADGATKAMADQVEVIVIDTSGSMTEEGGAKMKAAKAATIAAINSLSDGVEFAIVAGTHVAKQVFPRMGLAEGTRSNRDDAIKTVNRLRADGGTAMGTWLIAAAELFAQRPRAIRHCLLLTDGKNQHEPTEVLRQAIDQCEGLFQADCRGLGTDWNVDELRMISNALLGTVDIIPRPSDMEAEFQAIINSAMKKSVGDVALRLWSPKGATINFVKQVAPSIEDLTPKARPVNALTDDYPLGAWGGGESRDYHVQVQVPAGNLGDERLGARVMLAIDGEAQPIALVRAVWTDDANLSTRINREVAHYTGQAELAGAIHEGLAARASGDSKTATMKLGRAVQLAHETGNEDSVRLLNKVVDIENPETGTVRLKKTVAAEDEMALDVRSTRTVRVRKEGS